MNIIIIDDEQQVRQTLKKMLSQLDTEIQVLGEAGNVQNGISLVKENQPDLIFLDIELTDGTGFDLLKQIEDKTFQVIFITAYHEYAINAIKFSALDYILKPFDPEDIGRAIDKASKAMENEKLQIKLKAFLDNVENISKEGKKIVLNTSESVHLVNIQDIVRCQSDGNYSRFHLNGGKVLLVSKTLKHFDEMLTPFGFFRVHQSHLVNLDYLDHLQKENDTILMKDESTVPVSTRKKEQLISLLGSL